MRMEPSSIKSRLMRNLASQYPDILLYIDDPYISELVDAIFSVVAEEISLIDKNYISKNIVQKF